MLLAISDQTVALVGVISGAVLGLAGTLGVIFNTWFAKRAEQKARVLEGRSKAYERLLWYARRTMLDAERTYPLEEPAWGEPLGLLPDPEYLEISAAVAAFGTVSVLQAFEEFNAKVRYFFARADELKRSRRRAAPRWTDLSSKACGRKPGSSWRG